MKKWNTPEMVELAIEYTEKNDDCSGNTPTTGSDYKWKTNQCECGHNTNFAFDGYCENVGTHTPDELS